MSNHTTECPLAWSQSGDPIELPENATHWRVRRLLGGAKGGAPEVVYGPDGLPLVVERNATADDFAEAVDRRPGKYRLDALDAGRKPIAGVAPAYVMVGGSTAARESAGDEDRGSVDRVVRTLADAMRTQCAQITALVEAAARLINAADSAGVTRREPPPPPLVPTVDPAAEKRRNGRPDEDEDDDEDQDDDPESKGIVDQAAELYQKLGADGMMAYANAVPIMVGGFIDRMKAVMGGGQSGGGAGGAP
jgi:hypothetical protein